MTELKQVIVMRKDLGMRKGKMIAQGAHASVEAVLMSPDHGKRWRDRGATKIVVYVEGDEALTRVWSDAKDAGLVAEIIRDAGHTELEPGTYTCCAIGPGPADEIDKITGELPLL